LAVAKENIRLTFGLKIKQLRHDKGISLSELAHKTGISVSYLNEIEKGKKYPQTEKIVALAETLGVSYDWLVSLKLNKKLAPLADLLQSNFLSEFPLEVFGIEPAQFLDILANAPEKVGAFIGTLAEIARSHDMQIEEFYFSVLRSYQEMYENYFEDLEQEAQIFRDTHNQKDNTILDINFLKGILQADYRIQIQEVEFEDTLNNLRSVLKGSVLLINKNLSVAQKRFVLCREIGFAYLKIKKRSATFSWVEVRSFDEVLNNFKASYFAGALLLPQNLLINDLKAFFKQKHFNAEFITKLNAQYEVTSETLLYRFSNLLPKHFGLNELFFLRFDNTDEQFNLTKEMHISGLHNPHASALEEHYCRRWISITILQDLQSQTSKNSEILCKAQISEYYDSTNKFFVLAMARSMSPTPALSSLAIGIKINEQTQKTIQFLEDKNLPIKKVGETCQRCSATDCLERMSEPSILQKKQAKKARKQALEKLTTNNTENA